MRFKRADLRLGLLAVLLGRPRQSLPQCPKRTLRSGGLPGWPPPVTDAVSTASCRGSVILTHHTTLPHVCPCDDSLLLHPGLFVRWQASFRFSFSYHATWHCIIPHGTALHHTALRCTARYCIEPLGAESHHSAPMVLGCTVRHCIVPLGIGLYRTAPHHTSWHCTTWLSAHSTLASALRHTQLHRMATFAPHGASLTHYRHLPLHRIGAEPWYAAYRLVPST